MKLRNVRFPAVLAAVLLTSCASHPPAPIVERSSRPPAAEIPVDGLYRVRGGDTLYGIAFKYGLDHRDIASWNAIRAPYTIYPDQVLRLREPPGGSVTTTAARTPASRTAPAKTPVSPPKAPPATPATTPEPVPDRSPAPARTASAGDWLWPVDGRLLRSFKAGDPTRKGVDIVGREGTPVKAAREGEVVYSGNGLIGYGELVIIKHDDRMLSAYAHNRRRLVAEGERVRAGQTIAEVGRNDRNEAVLHFEIRRDGKPVDPLGYLPSR